jgi:hypothetical protein
MDNWKLWALAAYNCTHETVSKGLIISGILFNALCNFLNGTSNEWYFLLNSPYSPVPAAAFATRPTSNRIRWIYNAFVNTLVPGTYNMNGVARRFRWLSTTLIVDGNEYALDEFIGNLVYIPSETQTLTHTDIATAYFIYSKRWPTTDRDVEMNIIDEEGDTHVFTVNHDADQDEWSALLHVEQIAAEYIEEDEDEEADAPVTNEEAVAEAPVTNAEAPVTNTEAETPVTNTEAEAPVTNTEAETPVTALPPSPVEDTPETSSL